MSDIILTEDQQKIYDDLWAFSQGSSADGHMALLTAPAGAGKSTLIMQFIIRIMENAMFNNIAITAPTHKALRVVKEMLPKEYRNKVLFSSLHSLLGLKHKVTNTGKEVFERDKNQPSKFGLYDLVIVDEASMVSDQLFHELQDQNYRGVKVVFVGDHNQINPVNHSHSIPMLPEKREQYNIKKHELTKIVRQAEGNPIINVSQRILNDEFKFVIGEKSIADNKGYAMLNKNQPEVLHTLLRRYFCSEEFNKDSNYCKLIAWRNATVDTFNKIIRGMKYGMHSPKIVLGEKLLVEKPIKMDGGDKIIFNTNDDLEVIQLKTASKRLYDMEFKFYDAMVQSEADVANIPILHEDSQQAYNILLKKLSEDAKSEKDSFKRGQKWIKYYDFINNFAWVKYNIAITAHNSQGSTYTNAFVVYNDIVVNQNDEECKRILYTACTRPKEMLFLL